MPVKCQRCDFAGLKSDARGLLQRLHSLDMRRMFQAISWALLSATVLGIVGMLALYDRWDPVIGAPSGRDVLRPTKAKGAQTSGDASPARSRGRSPSTPVLHQPQTEHALASVDAPSEGQGLVTPSETERMPPTSFEDAKHSFDALLQRLDGKIEANQRLSRSLRAQLYDELRDTFGRLTQHLDPADPAQSVELEQAYFDMVQRAEDLRLHDHEPTRRELRQLARQRAPE